MQLQVVTATEEWVMAMILSKGFSYLWPEWHCWEQQHFSCRIQSFCSWESSEGVVGDEETQRTSQTSTGSKMYKFWKRSSS
ncbi:unnamed protein product, partial [Nesidiocoris tenuis]